jgi:Ni,Fe-hydrogenase III component G
MVGRALTPANLRYETVIKDFTDQWKALKTRMDGDNPEVPAISKALPTIKRTEAFDDFLSCAVSS